MTYPTFRQRAVLAAVTALGLIGLSAPSAVAAPDDPVAPYLGTWNYDRPDPATMTDMATLDLPGYTATFPQIGTVDFRRGENGEVIGYTDQGCTWRFRVEADALEMTSTDQYCFNRNIGAGYNVDRWRIRIDGDHEWESLHANSYLVGASFSFDLVDGRRTRASAADRDETLRRFAGSWRLDPPDPTHMVGIANVNNALGLALPVPVSGGVEYRAATGDTIIARTDDGCEWTLEAHGNTAELSPETQTCHGMRRNLWAVASDGTQQTTAMAGIDAGGSPFYLSNGSLHRG
ncbi:hypothetical protein BJY24_003147 [Nocardia transvalensis]|uniref:META domain-containing protein n=1 Tax=Nocardia transvalensis TaxID=37333 RepID=A0A7W9UJ16_9NOCA|nr:hypothetical protein [Nocardia transvalensis]MBB5914280.1 hypothetical protein [Nocardia transvalensis]